MSFNGFGKKEQDIELREAVEEIQRIKAVYREECRIHADARAAYVYPGATDTEGYLYYKALTRYKKACKEHSEGCTKFKKALIRNKQGNITPTLQEDDILAAYGMADVTNGKEIEKVAEDIRKSDAFQNDPEMKRFQREVALKFKRPIPEWAKTEEDRQQEAAEAMDNTVTGIITSVTEANPNPDADDFGSAL